MGIKLKPGQYDAIVKKLGQENIVVGPKAKIKMGSQEINPAVFLALCDKHGLPKPIPQYLFHETRKWRFDFAWDQWLGFSKNPLVALEIDGGIYSGGRHTRGAGYRKDQEKMNEAVIIGWRVLHCQPCDVKSGKVFEMLKRVFH
jgi:hypothetical protein